MRMGKLRRKPLAQRRAKEVVCVLRVIELDIAEARRTGWRDWTSETGHITNRRSNIS